MIAPLALVPDTSAPMTVLLTGATSGAGTSTVTANLAYALGALGSRVEIVDLAPYGIDALGPREWAELVDDVDHRRRDADFVLLDAARASSALALDAAGLADQVLLVVHAATPVTAAADAVRELYRAWPDADVAIIVNCATAEQHAEGTFCRLALARPAEAGGPVAWLGHVVADVAVGRAREAGRLVAEYLPHAPASRSVRAVAARLLGVGAGPSAVQQSRGHLGFTRFEGVDGFRGSVSRFRPAAGRRAAGTLLAMVNPPEGILPCA